MSIQWIRIREINCVIHWIVIYPVDSATHRLLAVPQDGHESEEIEQSERKQKTRSRGEAGEEAPLSSFPLGHFALSSPAELRLD